MKHLGPASKKVLLLLEAGFILSLTRRPDYYFRILKKVSKEWKEIKKPARWDKLWRLVIFDIPEEERTGRMALAAKLKELGFYPLQKSVFIHPYECKDEIDFI